MATFYDKKEADISGRRASGPRDGSARRTGSSDRRGKGKDKVNGNHVEAKAESGSEVANGENENEGTPEA